MITPHHRDLVTELLRKELKVRYKRLALGYLWSILSPLLYAGLYYVVFGRILQIRSENYPLFLIAGLFPWQWMTNTINVAPTTFISNSALIKKTLFPRYLIPFVVAIQDGLHFLVSLPVVILFVVMFGGVVSWEWVYGLPLLMAVQFCMAYSLNLMIATFTVFFRDIERFLQIGMTFLFYMTPILYSETMIPAEYQHLIIYHPMAPLMINWRSMFMQGTFNFQYLLASAVWSLVFFLFAKLVYRKLSWRFAEVL